MDLYKALFEDLLKAGHTIHLIESVSTRKDPVIPDSIEHHPNFSFDLVPLTITSLFTVEIQWKRKKNFGS